jgi:hydrophobe/amphiphile efflux-1 (HAE1) family protein
VNLSEPFIRRPIATSLLMGAVAFTGIAAFPFLPVASLPQIDFPTIQVTATLSGASADTMASSVAAPLERQFAQISGITQMTSVSTLGATQVAIQFDLNKSIDSAAQDVQAAISIAGKTLPQGMTIPPNYRKINPADPPILVLGARSETLPLTSINDYLDRFLAQQIAQVPGVAQAQIGGDRRPSIRIQVDPAKLAAIGLTLEEIRTTIVNSTTNAPKGTLYTDEIGFIIAANDQITDADPFNDVVLAYRNGGPIRVRDVGRAVADASNRNLAGYQNNELGILLNIFKQPGANVIETVDLIKAQLSRLTANLPPAMTVETILDRTQTIRASVREVEFTLALTIGLVVMVILLFLRNVWATIIPSITIPLALLGSFAAMYLLNFSIDNISLMALTIAIGFVVDDAIVVVENIYRHIEEGEPPFEAALKGSREIGFTVLSISLSLVAVFIPLLLMGGIIGRLFREFALTVTASVAISCVVSLTLAPMLCSRFLKGRSSEHGRVYWIIEAGFSAMLSGYQRTLDFVLRHQFITLCVFFGTVALTIYLAIQAPKGFIPSQDTGLIAGVSEAAQSTSPAKMMRLQRDLGEIVLRDPDVQAFTSQTGNNDNPNTANTGRFLIVLKPRDERKSTAAQVVERLRPKLAAVQGANLFLQVTQDINVGIRVGRGSFEYTLQAVDIDELTEWSQKMLEKMRALPELTTASSDLLANGPQLKVNINRDQAARYGISPQAIDDTLYDAFGQRQVTQYFTQLNASPIILEILPELQGTLESLDRLYVKSPLTGAAVPLSTLVDIDTSKVGPLQVTHQGQFPSVTLTFNVRPGVALGQAVDAITQASRDIGLPGTVIGTFQGNAQAFQSSLSSMPVLIIAALIVVYLILGILYESYIHPLTILSTLPSAGVGALLALQAGHMDLSVIGIIGIILLIGIVKKNGIMLVDFAIVAERHHGMTPLAASL